MQQVKISYRIVIITEDRNDDARVLREEILAQSKATGGRRAKMTVDINASKIGLQTPEEPNTVVAILSRGSANRTAQRVIDAAQACLDNLVPILPVFDPTAGNYPSQQPQILSAINGFGWETGTSAGTTASRILKLAGLAEEDQRIFISYRQVDGASTADQLRHSLIDQGWDVFLDRFSIPPAVDFQKRLDRELADKAFVLLLETPRAGESQWVDHEIAFALHRRLGLLSVTFPDTAGDQEYSAIHESWRIRLNWSHFEPSTTILKEAALDEIILDIDKRHAESVALRRQSTLLETSEELRSLGYAVEPVDDWALLAVSGAKRELALVTARAPEAADLRRVDLLRRRHKLPSGKTRGWVVHPTEDVDTDRVDLLKWMSKHRSIRPTPLMLLADRIAR